jgi:hypothetical protein
MAVSYEDQDVTILGTVVVTAVAASTGNAAQVRVSVRAPAATLVAELGSAVGVPVVSNLLREDGTPIPPGSTLDSAGVGNRAKVVVVGNRDPHQAGPVAVANVGRPADLAATQDSPVPPTRARPEVLAGRTIGGLPDDPGGPRVRRILVVGGAVALAAVLVVVGLLIGRATTSDTPAATTPPPAAIAVAAAWADASRYSGALLAGVLPGLGRSGRLTGVIEPVGFHVTGSTQSTWFVVVPSSGQAFGLTVQLAGGSLAGPPAISPLPFGAGALPPSSGDRVATPSDPSKTVADWATQTFGAHGALLTSPGVGLVGTPKVVAEWRPEAGGSVMQVQVELSDKAAGTPATALAAAAASAKATVQADATERAKDSAALARANAALARANAALAQANAGNASAQQALAAANAAAAANPAAVPQVAPATAAAAASAAAVAAATTGAAPAQSAVTTAEAAVTADQAKQKTDQAALKAAQAKETSPFTTVGRYDVWVTSGHVTGWVPAGYQGG